MALSRTIVENRAKIVMVRLLWLKNATLFRNIYYS